MLLTGQPLHAFDLDRVPGGEVIVRAAHDGETMTTLDGVERTFDDEMVLVCDREQPTGIAGVMGGQVSEVSEATARVLLEAATWNGPNVLRTSHELGLRVGGLGALREAAPSGAHDARPARRVAADPRALRAPSRPRHDRRRDRATALHVITLRGARVEGLLGVAIDRDEAATTSAASASTSSRRARTTCGSRSRRSATTTSRARWT